MRILLFLLLSFVCELTHTLHINHHDKYLEYLTRYGYLDESSIQCKDKYCKVRSNKIWRDAVKSLQHFAHVEETGELDNKTKHWMSLSRCAYRDVHRRRRSKRYTIGGKWRKKFIQYKIKYTPKLDRRYVDSKIAMAFMIWSPSSGITFVKRDKGPVDIIIEFGSSELHSDKIVLANTKSAGITSAGITIRINDEVLWEENFESDAPNLFQTVAHEVGHAIGLGHTDVLGAMMYPVYGYGRKVYSLHQDDIRGAKDAYNFQVVSYPGRFQYRQFRKTITKSFDDLRSKMKHSFGKDIKPLNIPEEFFSKGF